MPEEQILIVDREKLFGIENRAFFEGFQTAEEAGNMFKQAMREHAIFVERSGAEKDPSKKQIIPYCVFSYAAPGDPQLFIMKRLLKAGEKRLHGNFSIGIGGHINPTDKNNDQSLDLWKILAEDQADQSTPLWSGMRREFTEEVHYEHPRNVRIIGYINDESNSVGQVHFGVVFWTQGNSPDISIKEADELKGELMPVSHLQNPEGREIQDKFENWSKIIYPHIIGLLKTE
ncbi:MAG: hypothetical protein KAT43_02090 [Nanoarchaeota archaeon]|nr:hypothetical protein [Nanoarchaeota archaeon]